MSKGRALGLFLGLLIGFCATGQAVTLDWVTVGDAGNLADEWGYGEVDYEYRMSKYEITAGQYCEFLNAVAGVDTYGLYSTTMGEGDQRCRIERYTGSGTPGDPYRYRVGVDWADRPVNDVSFWDAARFANWMHNGQPTGAQGPGTTEDGAYTNVGDQAAFARQPGALIVIPNDDEWYKAAYYDPNKGGPGIPGYWVYPTMSDTAPSNLLVEPDPGNNATFKEHYDFTIGPPYYRTEVGAHENSESAFGTFDQGGNVWEWSESRLQDSPLGDVRCVWGGDYRAYASSLHYRSICVPHDGNIRTGFRLASPAEAEVIPEPATLSLFGIAAAALLRRRRRRRA